MSVSVASYPSLVNTPLRGAGPNPEVRTPRAVDLVAEALRLSFAETKSRLPLLLSAQRTQLLARSAVGLLGTVLFIPGIFVQLTLMTLGLSALGPFERHLGGWGPVLVSGTILGSSLVGLGPPLLLAIFAAGVLSGMRASLIRALTAAHRGDAPLTEQASFSSFRRNLFPLSLISSSELAAVLVLLASFVGAPLIPLVLLFSRPLFSIVTLHDVGLWGASGRAAAALRRAPASVMGSLVLGTFAITLLHLVPVLGWPWVLTFEVHLFRALFGEAAPAPVRKA